MCGVHLDIQRSNKSIAWNCSWPCLSLLHHWSKPLRDKGKLGSYNYKLGRRTSTISIPRSIIASCLSFNLRVPCPILRFFSNFNIAVMICDHWTSTSQCRFTRLRSFKRRRSWSINWTSGINKNNILTNQRLNYKLGC